MCIEDYCGRGFLDIPYAEGIVTGGESKVAGVLKKGVDAIYNSAPWKCRANGRIEGLELDGVGLRGSEEVNIHSHSHLSLSGRRWKERNKVEGKERTFDTPKKSIIQGLLHTFFNLKVGTIL